MSEISDTPPLPIRPPQQNGPASAVVAGPDLAGLMCFICGDEKESKPFAAGDPVVNVPTDQGELHQHALCFYVNRSAQLEAMLSGATRHAQEATAAMRAKHETLCAVLSKTGIVRIFPHNRERARKAGYQLEATDQPDGSMVLKLSGMASIEVVSEMPAGKPS